MAQALAACGARAPEPRAAGVRSLAASDEVGLLVALSSGKSLWIAPQGGAMRLLATKSNLLVPRTDGFWWVGVSYGCTVEELNGGGVNLTEAGVFVSRDAALFVARAGDTARVSLAGGNCEDAEREAMTRRDALARAGADSAAAAGDSAALLALRSDTSSANHVGEDLYCSLSTREVTFASPTALSVESRYTVTEFCSPAKYYTSGGNDVTRFATDERIPLRPLLAPPDRAALTKQLSESGACGLAEEPAADDVEPGWAIRRDRGGWVGNVFVDGPIVCRGGSDLGLAVPLPASFTGDAPLPVAWADLKRQVPALRDGAGSPAGGHLALLVGDTLFVVRVRGGSVAETLVRVPVEWGDGFVMVRWASAAEAAQWNRVVPGLPEPVVRVEAPASR